MTYSVPTANGTLTGPPVVQAANGATVPFDVILTPDQCLDPGNMVVGLIEAAGNGYTDQAIIDKTLLSAFWSQIASEPNSGRMDNVGGAWNDLAWSITGYGADANVRTYDPATDTWADVGTPAPFGVNYVRSGCQFNDVVVMYARGHGRLTDCGPRRRSPVDQLDAQAPYAADRHLPACPTPRPATAT